MSLELKIEALTAAVIALSSSLASSTAATLIVNQFLKRSTSRCPLANFYFIILNLIIYI